MAKAKGIVLHSYRLLPKNAHQLETAHTVDQRTNQKENNTPEAADKAKHEDT